VGAGVTGVLVPVPFAPVPAEGTVVLPAVPLAPAGGIVVGTVEPVAAVDPTFAAPEGAKTYEPSLSR